MPATSKAQFRYMQGVAHGSIPPPSGFTRAQAAEYVQGQSPKALPERAAKPKAKGSGKRRFMTMRRAAGPLSKQDDE